MKVLFVRSGNKGIDPVTQNQGDSLTSEGCVIYYYDIIGKGIWGYLQNFSKLRKEIIRIDPDIIHAHYASSGFLSSLIPLKKRVVVSLMGSDINEAGRLYLYLQSGSL